MKWIELPFAKFVGLEYGISYDKLDKFVRDGIPCGHLFAFDRNGIINIDSINYITPSIYSEDISRIFLKSENQVIYIYTPYNKLKEKLNTLN